MEAKGRRAAGFVCFVFRVEILPYGRGMGVGVGDGGGGGVGEGNEGTDGQVGVCGCGQLRVYTAANIRSELAAAKNEYLRAAVGISRNDVVLLPKVLDW